jgi:IS5 family transposase
MKPASSKWILAAEAICAPASAAYYATLARLELLDDPILEDLLAPLVTLGPARGVIQSRRLRIDTTVVETNIHYPTDATLLADGVRVLTRSLQRLGQRVRQRARSVARRVFEIAAAQSHCWPPGPRN